MKKERVRSETRTHPAYEIAVAEGKTTRAMSVFQPMDANAGG